ncbi:MAG: thrombospondin type 3 repeat-containing protein [Acidimicrobiales bacterium]
MESTTLSLRKMMMAASTFALILVLTAAFFAPASAQSGGCPNGPFAGATPTDSDGDGVSDADEILAGSDECDPTSVISTPAPPTPVPPRLALTGPSTAMLSVMVGMALIIVGAAAMSLGKRAES